MFYVFKRATNTAFRQGYENAAATAAWIAASKATPPETDPIVVEGFFTPVTEAQVGDRFHIEGAYHQIKALAPEMRYDPIPERVGVTAITDMENRKYLIGNENVMLFLREVVP